MVKICRALSSDTVALRGHTGHLLDCVQRRVDVTVLWALWVGFRLSECLFVAAVFFLLISSSSNDFKKIKTSKELFSRSNVTMCKPLRYSLKWNEGVINKSILCTYP